MDDLEYAREFDRSSHEQEIDRRDTLRLELDMARYWHERRVSKWFALVACLSALAAIASAMFAGLSWHYTAQLVRDRTAADVAAPAYTANGAGPGIDGVATPAAAGQARDSPGP